MKHISVRYTSIYMVSLLLLVFTNFLILFDLYPIRQVFSILYFSFFPGLLLISLISLDDRDLWYILHNSIGISIAVSIFLGLLANFAYLLFALAAPLTTFPLLITLDGFIIILATLGFLKNRSKRITFDFEALNQPLRNYWLVLSLTIIPLLTIIGVKQLDSVGSNTVLLLMIAFAVLSVAFIVSIGRERFPTYVYMYALFTISVSLLYMWSLRSDYIIGYDSQIEYYIFHLTQRRGFWNRYIPSDPYNTVVSTTILPVVLSALTGIRGVQLFKIIYPIYFSLIPLIFFSIFSRYFDKSTAFLSIIFFMGTVQYSPLVSGQLKEAISFMFFSSALSSFLDLVKKARASSVGLFLFFGFLSLASQYATVVKLVPLFAIATITSIVLKRREQSVLSIRHSLAFGVFAFFWYAQLTELSFSMIIGSFEGIFRGLLLDLHPSVADLAAPPSGSSILEWIPGFSGKLAKYFIVTGTVYYLLSNYKKRNFIKEYACLCLSALLILLTYISIPLFHSSYNPDRLYLNMVFILAPMALVGLKAHAKVLEWLPGLVKLNLDVTRLVSWLMIFFVLSYFLSGTGFFNQLSSSKDYEGILLQFNTHGDAYDRFYIHDSEYFAIAWLLKQKPEIICADRYSVLRLSSLGSIPNSDRYEFINKKPCLESPKSCLLTSWASELSGFVFLRFENRVNSTFKELMKGSEVATLDMAILDPLLNNTNRVYDNGGSTIYRK